MRIPISSYKPFYSYKAKTWLPGGEPFESEFFTEVRHIINGKHRSVIEQCRNIQDKRERSSFKAQNLPAFTTSCICVKWRGLENVVEHSGLLNIDIDAEDNPQIDDWPKFRDFVCGFPYTLAAFLSASGKGVSFVVKIFPTDHADSFYSLADELSVIGVKVDYSCKDVTRLRFTSWDEDGFINPNEFDDIRYYRPTLEYMHRQFSREPRIPFIPEGAADLESTYILMMDLAKTDKRGQPRLFEDGSKHYYLVAVAGHCCHNRMSEQFCIDMTNKYFSHLTSADILTPIKNVYKKYSYDRIPKTSF